MKKNLVKIIIYVFLIVLMIINFNTGSFIIDKNNVVRPVVETIIGNENEKEPEDNNDSNVENDDIIIEKPVTEIPKEEDNSKDNTSTITPGSKTNVKIPSVEKKETKEETKANPTTPTNPTMPTNPTTPSTPDTPTDPSTPEDQPKTLTEENEELVTEIYNMFGYHVTYKDESFYYNAEPCVELTDETKINKALKQLIKTSKLFPTNFFKTFIGYNGYRVVLFEEIPGAAGVASYEFGDDNKLLLDVNKEFGGRTFAHETWHIMEQYIKYRTYGKPNPFGSWENLNPVGFTYSNSSGNIYTVFSYDYSIMSYPTPINEVSFVSEYAKSAPWEDRAELFADLMFRPFKKDYMASGFGVNEKAKALSQIIRNYFPNSTGASWERWITW